MAQPDNREQSLDKTVIGRLCDAVSYDMMRDSINPDTSFCLSVNHKFVEKIQHTFYRPWSLEKRKRVIYLDVTMQEEHREISSLIFRFIAKLGDLMNSIIVVNCNSKESIFVYKCLKSLLESNNSLYDLIKLSFFDEEATEERSVLSNIGKNEYHALLKSDGGTEELLDGLCELIFRNDFNRDKREYRLLWISSQAMPSRLLDWELSNSLHFAMPDIGNKAQVKLVSSECDSIANEVEITIGMDEALGLVLRAVPLKEFVHSNNLRIVQYLMKERIMHNKSASALRESDGETSLLDSYSYSPVHGRDPMKSIFEQHNADFDVITSAPMDNQLLLLTQPHDKSIELEHIKKGQKYEVEKRNPDDDPTVTISIGSIDPQFKSEDFSKEVVSELAEALTEALHGGNTPILSSLIKPICTYLDKKAKSNSQLNQFFNFEYLEEQYQISYQRKENYFCKLMSKLGIREDSNRTELNFTAVFLDSVLDRLMYQNLYHCNIHQTLNSSPNDSKRFFQLYLFIWGLLTQNIDSAEHALKWYPSTNEQIATALAGTRLLEGIIKLLKNDHEISSDSIRHLGDKKLYFENLALSLLKEDECVQEDETTGQIRTLDPMATLQIDLLADLRNNTPTPKRIPVDTYENNSQHKNERLNFESEFWKSTILEMAHQGECKLFISSEEVQSYVHQKNLEFNIKRKLLLDLIMFHLLFYIFHCLLSLKLIAEPQNSSREADVIYLALLALYGVIVITFMVDNLIRSFVKKSQHIGKVNATGLVKLLIPSRADGYIKIIFYICFLIGYPLRMMEVAKSEDFPVRFSALFFSINSLLLFIDLLRKALTIDRKLSITVHLFISSIKKNMQLVILAFIFMIGFGVAQYILKCSQTTCKLHEHRGIWDYVLWIFLDTFKIMFGAYDLTQDVINEATPLITTFNFSSEDTNAYSAQWILMSTSFALFILLIIWQFISNIIIINLLIANFIKIYEDISKEADLLWKKELLRTYFRYKDWSFIPFFCLSQYKKREKLATATEDNNQSSVRPVAGRYWRQRDENERKRLKLSSNEDRIENTILTLVASNYYTRRQIRRIENLLEMIHNEELPSVGDSDMEVEDLISSFIL